ncbi:YjfK family protein [Roseomonas gilardii subsp. gilardii]|uniref:DUF2491 family protein n=1 Tax=Roseomonas gilardii TaxID=257708 RepID=UPI001FF9B7C9|nr:DUF2491 family protein [Roseomonas gilardii]UPG72858.1 YjfK family protein [Roseomonas gilardii subsp. gilardii]
MSCLRQVRPGLLSAALACLLLALPVADALARPGAARSSGGYSRPGYSAAPSRTPSFGGHAAPSRTPSSGGYARPDSGFGRIPSMGGSASDRSYNREAAGDALRRMREREASRSLPAPAPGGNSQGGNQGGGWGGSWGGNWNTGRAPAPRGTYGGPDWYRDRGWNPSGPVLAGPRGFGMWDAAFLWFLLSTLNRPGHTDFFRNHQDDPALRDWRAQAEQAARNDPQIRAQLDQLDRSLAQQQGQPRDPDYLPPDVPPEVATANRDAVTPAEHHGAGIGMVLGVVVVGGGLLGALAMARNRRPGAGGNSGGGGGMPRTGTMGSIASAGDMLRHKMSGEGYTPERYRLGMTVTLDPTPFLLAGGGLKAAAPQAAQRLSVEGLGRITGTAPGDSLLRLYLPGDASPMLQLHPGPGGTPEECRYFTLLDEITPADEAEWQVWLDPREGMIGWPEFQTKDGRRYSRLWQPGTQPVPPRELRESLETTAGTRERRCLAMLYAAPTGAPTPAPQTEYVLVQSIEEGNAAWVEVRAGIDINPASLGLAG